MQIEFRKRGEASTILVDNFAFGPSPRTYQITADGVSEYELVFREDDNNNRSRFNGMTIAQQ